MIHRLQHDYKNGQKTPLPHSALDYFIFRFRSSVSSSANEPHCDYNAKQQQPESEQPQQQKSLKTMHSFECCWFRCLLVCFIRTDEHWSTCCHGRLWLHCAHALITCSDAAAAPSTTVTHSHSDSIAADAWNAGYVSNVAQQREEKNASIAIHSIRSSVSQRVWPVAKVNFFVSLDG